MNDIEKIITDEKYNLELKEQVSFEEPKKYLKAVSSFANGYDIGYVIFGVEDGTKRIVGVKDIKKSYEEVANRIKTRIDPSIIPTIDIVNIQGKDLIVVKVIPGQHTPYYYVNKGTRIAYIRKGDQDCETNSTELNELILRGRNQGWDELVTDNLYKDFTFEKLKKYFKDIKDYKIEKEDLESFGLLSGEKLTNAALLYSDQNPVVGSFISCTRWNGLDKLSAKDDIEFYGSILNQIDNAMEFIKKHMSNGWVKEGGKLARRTIPEYDLDAMREALINAEAHRSYLMRGTNVELAFYDDRIEIVSCGKIGNGKTLEELLKRPTSQRRNQLVCDIFSRLDFMERRGSGIKKIFQAYENDEKRPKFEIIDDVFIVTFYSRLYREVEKNDYNVDVNVDKNVGINVEIKIKEKYPELSNTSIDIIKLVENNNYITQPEIAKELDKATNTVYRNIKVLKDMGILERVGSNKKGYWRINY